MLQAHALSYDIEDGGGIRHVLDRIDLRLHSGRSYAVTGPSGCGKTTLLSILALVGRPTGGRLLYGDTDLFELDETEARRFRRDHIGLVFQTFRLLDDLTVREQLVFAAGTRRRAECVERGFDLLERFGLSCALDRLPRALSGGEKQRVALARALMFSPSIVLADEPTAALDPANAELAAGVLVAYAREQRAVVVAVSHDRRLVERCCERIAL